MPSEADATHLTCPPWTQRDYERLQELRARVKAAAAIVEAIDRRPDNMSFAEWDAAADVDNLSEHFAGDLAITSGAATRVATTTTTASSGGDVLSRSALTAQSPMGMAEYPPVVETTAPTVGGCVGAPSDAQFDSGLGALDSTVAESAAAFAATSRNHPFGGHQLNESDQAELVALEGRYSVFTRLERERRATAAAAAEAAADASGVDPAMDVGAFLQRAGKASWFWTSLVATASAAVASKAGVITELHHWDVVLSEPDEGNLILGALPVVTGLDHITKLKGQCEGVNRDLGLIVSCMHEDEMHGFGLSAFATHSRWYQAFNITPPNGSPVTSPTAPTAAATAVAASDAVIQAPAPRPAESSLARTAATATSTSSAFRCMLFQIDDCSATGATEAQMVSTVHAIHETLRSGRSVYVHCKAGKGRSWMVAACYLLTHWVEARRGDARENFQVVVNHIRNRRPQVSPSGSQLEFAERYAEFVLRDMTAREQLQLDRAPGAFSNGVVISHHQMPYATAASV